LGCLLDPEGPKRRELLSLRLRGLVGEAARRQTVDLRLAERPKVAGALKDGDLVEHGARVDGEEHAESGEADVLGGQR
jgi:hypothetical protein